MGKLVAEEEGRENFESEEKLVLSGLPNLIFIGPDANVFIFLKALCIYGFWVLKIKKN